VSLTSGVGRGSGAARYRTLAGTAGLSREEPESRWGSLFQRRALVELAGQRFVVVESMSDSLTMQQFGEDLLELGAYNALYLDMGDWDEGWYKTGKQVVKLGHRRTETGRQSNWLVLTSSKL
jgi:hypothetical protein